jgi:hypothetical protein
METLEQIIRKNFIKLGLFLGLALITLSIFSFYFITKMATSPQAFVAGPLIYSIVIPIMLVIAACFYGRKQIGGYWNFKQATTGIFIMFLIAYGMQTIGRDFIFARLIEPQMIEKTEKAFLNSYEIIRKQPGTNVKQLDENKTEVLKNFDAQKKETVTQLLMGIAISIIFIFAMALVFAALFKNDPEVRANTVESK